MLAFDSDKERHLGKSSTDVQLSFRSPPSEIVFKVWILDSNVRARSETSGLRLEPNIVQKVVLNMYLNI